MNTLTAGLPMLPFRDAIRILGFRFDRALLDSFGPRHVVLGLLGAWLAGLGRYYDSPTATALQQTGLGSVVYVFVLSALLFALARPFRIRGWAYSRVLTFVSLVSFPALLYAVPVERFTTLPMASRINAYFLLLVAAWRVALLWRFYRQATGLDRLTVFALTFLPLTAIVVALTVLNLERAVLNLMGGLQTENDGAYFVLNLLSLLSGGLFLPLLGIYAGKLYQARKKR